MKLILTIFGFAFLFSCESRSKLRPDLEESIPMKSDTVHFFEPMNTGDRTENHSISCYYDELSNQFNVTLDIDKISRDSSKIFIKIVDKFSKKQIDVINVQTQWVMLPPMFANCENVRSFTTGINTDKEVVDNEHGDFIIADFNFDDLDDFAIAVDFGGNGGTIYSFYLQGINGKFELDQFLSETMLRFPVLFDRKKKTLTTSVHANAYENSETVYQYRNGTWKKIEEKMVKL